jgi:MerR family redox-sensitive transcriptional activator SoxR
MSRDDASEDSLDDLIAIGELSARTGVAASALRYYEELGLLTPRTRISGRRLYGRDAVTIVGLVRFLRDAQFRLSEIAQLMTSESDDSAVWHRLAERKIAELDDLIARAGAAREALDHGRHCPHSDPRDCPTFWRIVARHQVGQSIAEAHANVHAELTPRRR